MATDRFPTQDPRAMYPGAVSQQSPQTSMAIVTPRQPISSPQQHQVAYMKPQQQPFSASSQQLIMNNPSVNLNLRQQHPLCMPTYAPIQQHMPGTEPVNIDLGKIPTCNFCTSNFDIGSMYVQYEKSRSSLRFYLRLRSPSTICNNKWNKILEKVLYTTLGRY